MPAWRMKEKFPERILEKAVWGMLPKNKLRYHRFKMLRVYPNDEHEHHAQEYKAATLPPHFKHHAKPETELLAKDDPMAHLREFYVVKFQQTDDAIRADGVYIPTLKEERKKEKQIQRYIRRRPTQIEDLPDFPEYVVDAHNAPVKVGYGFDNVRIVREEVIANREKGKEPIPRQKEYSDEAFYDRLQAEMPVIEEEGEQKKE